MQQQLDQIAKVAKQAINDSQQLEELIALRVQYLGKKGELTELSKQVSSLPKEDRPLMGKAVNVIKRDIQTLIDDQLSILQQEKIKAQLTLESVDVTLPGREPNLGSVHPVTRVRDRAERLFIACGFSVKTGPEIEDEQHNFNALNIPESHPARAMADTFYLQTGELLRTHTSPVQIRTMESEKPPLRIIAPGRVFRRDSDHTHTPMFHQLEGLVIERDCTFAHLKGLLHDFVTRFFEMDLQLRFRPSYFPFTEPSAEVDIQCTACLGSGCRVCGHSGWLEVLGCGMVHPNVLEGVGIDTNEFSGYAFGVGLDRLAMLRYKIPDLRMLFENDINFLQQF
jgi:phenylalanyl-tRNA synthetase alpha chain